MAVVISRSAVLRHVLPTPAEPAAVDHIGQQVADRASDKDGGERVLLNRTAHGLLALADGAARLRTAVQSVADETRTPRVGVLGQLGGALGDVPHCLSGLSDDALGCCATCGCYLCRLGCRARCSIVCHAALR